MKKNKQTLFIFIFAAAGFFIGAFIDGFPMGFALSFLGVMVYYIFDLRSRIQHIEDSFEAFKAQARQDQSSFAESPSAEDSPTRTPYTKILSSGELSSEAQSNCIDAESIIPETVPFSEPPPIPDDSFGKSAPDASVQKKPEPLMPPSENKPNAAFEMIKDFFTKGNVVVKVGVIVFFFGIGFLLKYAAEHSLLPIELRLTGAAVSGIVLLVLGFRLKKSRQTYATILQGAGIGVLYLTVFGAAKLYTFLPLGFAFAVMVGIVVFSGILAILQDAKSLAVFGIVGGFLSPILMSTGTGSHVALFSYYALLNLGIFGTAWFKSWRILNWVGFIFTFFIGFLWGYKYYQPKYFSTTEPFLILHFLFYATISVLFAHRQPVKLKGYIDGSLVFGLPVIAFALQSALVKDMEFGMAFSALGAGAFYVLLCFALWRKTLQGMKMLCESFLSLGIVFLSLAIPFAFDSGWTSGIWALEGAAVIWVGLKQKRMPPRYFGILLQMAAVISFFETVNGPQGNVPIANGVFLSCLAISCAAFLSNYFLRIYGWSKSMDKRKLIFLFPVLWGFFWWFCGGFNEIDQFIPYKYQFLSILSFIALSCVVFSSLQLKLDWKDIGYPLFILPYVNLVITVIFLISEPGSHPFTNWGWAAYIAVALIQYHILFHHEKTWKPKITGYMHRVCLYLIILLISCESAWAIGRLSPESTVWTLLPWGFIPGLSILLLLKAGPRISWPVKIFLDDYCRIGLLPVAAGIGIWMVILCLNPADPNPLPYLPVINPGDLVQIFCFLICIKWIISLKARSDEKKISMIMEIGSYLTAALVFMWFNTLIARGVHYWDMVPFEVEDMLDSVLFQAGISILWTIIALGSMVFAYKKGWRKIWFTGACLLAAVVLKLFLIDLVEIDTIARIVSFLVVGALMLVIGYFSPLPPKKEEITS